MSWWSDKINGGQQPAPQPQQQYVHPQAYAPAPRYAPQPQPHTQGSDQMVEFGGILVRRDGFDYVMQNGNIKNGAAKHERETCPECGDPRYFTREHRKLRKLNVKTGQMVSPAPICEACGYNGLYEQYGNQVALTTDEE